MQILANEQFGGIHSEITKWSDALNGSFFVMLFIQYFVFVFVFVWFVCLPSLKLLFREERIHSDRCHRFFAFRISHIKFIVVLWFHFVLIRMQVHSKLIFNLYVKRMLVIMKSKSEFDVSSHLMHHFVGFCFFICYSKCKGCGFDQKSSKQTVAICMMYDEQTLRASKYLQRETREERP